MPKEFEHVGKYECRWAEGDRAPFDFCAVPVKAGSSYCEEHHARVWVQHSGGKRIRLTDKPPSNYSKILPSEGSW
jgi:hypothetical protein